MENKEYIRNCPMCGKKVYHTTKRILNQSIKEYRSCMSCSKKSINNPNFGIKQSSNICLKKSYSQKQRYKKLEEREKASASTKRSWKNIEIRKKMIHTSKWINRRLDRGQLELLDKWNKLGFKFEPNYQIRIDDFLCYVDGYDKEKNVVLEYDGKYHHKLIQQKKDLVRQNKIISILNPKKFWRYDSVNKQCRNILGE
jgi:very-short-patch-repair endonuclease